MSPQTFLPILSTEGQENATFGATNTNPHTAISKPGHNLAAFAALRKLHGHYKPVVSEEEEASEEKTKRESDFIDACVNTKVMEITREWLSAKVQGLQGLSQNKFKELLRKMWFAPYARSNQSNGIEGSCAFEHVFLGEESRGAVKGFHNWFFFLEQGRVQQSRLSSQFALQFSTLPQLSNTNKNVPFHINFHFSLQL